MSTKKIINIVNFIRGEDWRENSEELHQTFINELELCRKYPMPHTFLMLYDAMIKPEYSEPLLANDNPDLEVGLWLELSKEAVERAGLNWNEEHNWTWHVNPGMLLGYVPSDREKIIDELMERFRLIFGYYPASVGSWIIDTHSINYMKEKYGVKAVCICREQYGTDGYTLWGGYYNQAYYPSRKNMFMPAQTKEEQVNVPIFRMLGPDPIYQYDMGLDSDYNMSLCQGVATLEPTYDSYGADEHWVNWYLDSIFGSEALSLAHTQAGQENSFTWKLLGKGLEMQMGIIYDGVKSGKWEVKSLKDTGAWFSERYDMTPATAVTALSDWQNKDNQTVWYDCKNYRANLHNKEGNICIRDMFLFDENYSDKYLDTPAPGDDAVFDTLPIVDGYCWGGNGIHSAMYFVKPHTDEKVKGKILSVSSENENRLKIEFELDGEKAVCVCDEEKIRFEFSGKPFDMLFKYNDLRNTVIKEIGESTVIYGHGEAEYGIKLTCGVKSEQNGYRISPDTNSFEISFLRL